VRLPASAVVRLVSALPLHLWSCPWSCEAARGRL
jgi:hypothetical protein